MLKSFSKEHLDPRLLRHTLVESVHVADANILRVTPKPGVCRMGKGCSAGRKAMGYLIEHSEKALQQLIAELDYCFCQECRRLFVESLINPHIPYSFGTSNSEYLKSYTTALQSYLDKKYGNV